LSEVQTCVCVRTVTTGLKLDRGQTSGLYSQCQTNLNKSFTRMSIHNIYNFDLTQVVISYKLLSHIMENRIELKCKSCKIW